MRSSAPAARSRKSPTVSIPRLKPAPTSPLANRKFLIFASFPLPCHQSTATLEACRSGRAIIRFLVRFLDLATIAVYLIAITWFGARFRKSQRSLKDYFLGGHAAPWWAISLSIVSAETSTLTVIGTPG